MKLKKQRIIENIEEIEEYRRKINIITNAKVEEFLKIDVSGIDLLRQMKFKQNGFDPLFDEKTNFIEQINQTFTYLVCLKAAEILITIYPTKTFKVNFGTKSGYDIFSVDNEIICECFAATAPDSNNKLKKDTEKVFNDDIALKKYVIYYASNPKAQHVDNIRKIYQGVKIIALDNI